MNVDTYLSSRGLKPDSLLKQGVEIEIEPDPHRTKQRLGGNFAPGVEAVLWFPLSQAGGWLALPLPEDQGPCCRSDDHPWIYIPAFTRNCRDSAPIYLVSGPLAALKRIQAGDAASFLDQSGSMEGLVTEAITSFNALVSEQQKIQDSTEDAASFSLALFNDTVRLLYDAAPITKVPPLTREHYAPAGGTALNDAIGQMIQAIGKRARRSSRVLVAILTDGKENASHRFSERDIFQMITYRRTTYDWQFIFIGPLGSESYALSIGIPKSNIVNFSADATGIKTVMARLSKGMKAYHLGDRRYMLKLRN